MTKDEFNLKYWMFYMQLENDFSKTFNYVEFTDDNLSTYSKEYAKQLISIGSELDIVFKALCNEVDPTKARSCITDYANILCGYDNLTDATVQFSYNKESYKPFDGWTPNSKCRRDMITGEYSNRLQINCQGNNRREYCKIAGKENGSC